MYKIESKSVSYLQSYFKYKNDEKLFNSDSILYLKIKISFHGNINQSTIYSIYYQCDYNNEYI